MCSYNNVADMFPSSKFYDNTTETEAHDHTTTKQEDKSCTRVGGRSHAKHRCWVRSQNVNEVDFCSSHVSIIHTCETSEPYRLALTNSLKPNKRNRENKNADDENCRHSRCRTTVVTERIVSHQCRCNCFSVVGFCR
jgi:hypothetical protein